MKVFITGVCGFVGRTLAEALAASGAEVSGLDNFSRPGSRSNLLPLQKIGVGLREGDVRDPDALGGARAADWIIDAAADASVVAGLSEQSPSRRLVDTNLVGTINLLEECKKAQTGFILLSTSRVYSIAPVNGLRFETVESAFRPASGTHWPAGLSEAGIAEDFSTAPPLSLYGSCKLASEIMALEYGSAFGFPVWINRCGAMAGAGQFGTADQGIFSYWINAWLRHHPLRYTGYEGNGHQVRDCFHPVDLVPVLLRQMAEPSRRAPRVVNFGGGASNAISLARLSRWCADRFGERPVAADPAERPFDLPWMILDSALAERAWGWRPRKPLAAILGEIAEHAERHPDWLTLSGVRNGR